MKHLMTSAIFSLFGMLVHCAPDVGVEALEKGNVCQVLPEGYEMIDDAPAINAAIIKCGNAGTIILPAGQLYSILSPIDLSPCRNCEVQLEGHLFLSNDPAHFATETGFISVSGANGVTFRSLTGEGVIDGRATTAYQRYRLDDPWKTQPPMVNIYNSTNIVVDNILAKNIIKRFYMVDGKSSNIDLTNLLLTVENQWWQEIWTRGESIGFHIRNASAVTLENITVDFWSNRPGYKVGNCVGIDYATDSITINNIFCHAGGGAMIQFATGGPPNIIPPADQQYATNILIRNYTANATFNTGLQNLPGYDDAYVHNLTYDGVNIIADNISGYTYNHALVNDYCYIVNGTTSTQLCQVWTWHLHSTFTETLFKDYTGNVDAGNRWYGHTNRTKLECCPGHCTCDFRFEGWPS